MLLGAELAQRQALGLRHYAHPLAGQEVGLMHSHLPAMLPGCLDLQQTLASADS